MDKNGNLTKDHKFRYEWNAFDQLTKVLTIAGDTVAEYQYDDQGRRVFKRLNKNGSNIDTYYRYNGTSNQVLFEEDANGNIIKSYTYDDNGYPLTMSYGGKTYYYLTNYRGDVLALVNETGERVATYTYDAWGNILTQNEDESIASINPYRYAGYRYDEETKLYYLMARYYNPNTGVFLSLDPVRGDITNPISLNGYNYANSNPVMNVDPEGDWAIPAFIIGGLFNSIPLVLSHFYKHKNLKGFNWWSAGRAFIVGGITSALGAGFYRALSKVGATLISKMISMASYQIKANILNVYSRGQKITVTSVLTGGFSGAFLKGTNIFSRALRIYKQGGIGGLKRFLKKITF